MDKIDFSKIANSVLSKQLAERSITEYKFFFTKYLYNVKNRNAALSQLSSLCSEVQNEKFTGSLLPNQKIINLETKIIIVLKNHFPNEILTLFQKTIQVENASRAKHDDTQPTWLQLLTVLFIDLPNELNEKKKAEWRYKINFLNFLYNCLYHFGLYPEINNREPKIYKRYNLLVVHDFKSGRNKQTEHRILLSPSNFQSEFLDLYEKKKAILIHGKLIPHKSIESIKITSSLLLDDEIELYAQQKNFIWNKTNKNILAFINLCPDETDQLLRNPEMIKEEVIFRNSNVYFIDPKRIEELKSIKSKEFDLAKLIQLCIEMNDVSVRANHYSASFLVRAIIDHVPPIFGFKNFSEVANNYGNGTAGFKKSMLNLNNSLRNIADSNIHSQIRQREVLPTSIQTDFTPELDLLLSEIIRILK